MKRGRMLEKLLQKIFESGAFREAVFREATSLPVTREIANKTGMRATSTHIRGRLIEQAIADGASNAEINQIIRTFSGASFTVPPHEER